MQPLKRALLHLRPTNTKHTVLQTLTTTTSNRILTSTLTRHTFPPLSLKALLTLSSKSLQSRAYTTGPPTVHADSDPAEVKVEKPSYELTFTCKPCGERSTHTVSKQGYHKGTVLITCPGCTNRHVIADHLGIFMDQKMTLEQMLKERGETFKKGVLSPNGDIELWPMEDAPEKELEKESEKVVGKTIEP